MEQKLKGSNEMAQMGSVQGWNWEGRCACMCMYVLVR